MLTNCRKTTVGIGEFFVPVPSIYGFRDFYRFQNSLNFRKLLGNLDLSIKLKKCLKLPEMVILLPPRARS